MRDLIWRALKVVGTAAGLVVVWWLGARLLCGKPWSFAEYLHFLADLVGRALSAFA